MPYTAHHQTHQTGFTLLEAIVAMVIFTGTMLAVYSWINTNLISLSKARQTMFLEQILSDARQQLQRQDFTQLSQSNYQWKNYSIHWQAQLMEPVEKGMSNMGGLGLYDFSLYQIQLDIYNTSQQLIQSYTLYQESHEKVRSAQHEQ